MNQLYQKAIDHYKTKESEAIAHLNMLFMGTVDEDDYPELLKEVIAWTEVLTNAKENIKTLEKNFGE